MYTLITASAVSDIHPNGIDFVNQNLEINGLLVVDRNLSFTNCRVRFGPYGSLATSGLITLKANCTVFTGCGNLWWGIYINRNSRFQFTDCLIREARKGIEIARGYKPPISSPSQYNRIVSCRFEHNELGIFVAGVHSQTVMLSPMRFEGNFFGGVTAGGPAFQPYAGILLQYARGHLGNSGSPDAPVNYFERTPFGVRVANSDVRIANCTFGGMASLPAGHPDYQNAQAGIYATQSFLRVSSSLTHKPCAFQGCGRYGVLSNNTRLLELRDNHFTDVGTYGLDYGLRSRFNDLPAKIAVENNDFDLYTYYHDRGIYLERPPASGYHLDFSSKINQNTFDYWGVQNKNQAAIEVRAPMDAFDRMQVSGNQVTFHGLHKHGSGLLFLGFDGVNVLGTQVVGNEVRYTTSTIPPANNDDYAGWGIGFQQLLNYEGSVSSFRNEIKNNEVTANTFTWNGLTTNPNQNIYSAVKCGIHVYESPHTNIAFNFVEKAMRQFHFANDNADTDFLCNDMGEGRFGLHCYHDLEPGITFMSDQIQKGNEWLTTATFYQRGAEHGDVEVNDDPGFYFLVNPNFQGFEPPTWSPTEWFNQLVTVPTCLTGQPPESPTGRYLNLQDSMLLEGTPVSISPASDWDMKRKLIRKLLESDAALLEHPEAPNWLANQVNSSPWQFVQVELGLRANITLSATAEDLLRQFIANEETMSTELQQALIDLENNPSDSLEIFTVLDSIHGLLDHLLAIDDSIRTQIQALRNINLGDYETIILDLPDTVSWEWARKQVLLATMDLYSGIPPDSALNARLQTISAACPDSVASAVLDARNLMRADSLASTITMEGVFNPCITLRGTRQIAQGRFELLKVWPNPAINRIVIDHNGDYVLEKWEIVDISGRIVEVGRPGNLPLYLSLENINPGYYWFRGYGFDGRIQTRPFVVAN